MGESKNRAFLKEPCVHICAIAGSILLALTLYYRVNPVEGSVVNEKIAGSAFHYFLLWTTMPAWMAGVFAGDATIISYIVMFAVQYAIFAAAGALLILIFRKLKKKEG